MGDEALTPEALDRLIVHYTPVDSAHSTPLQRQTLAALVELRDNRKCVHGIPRKFCTGAH